MPERSNGAVLKTAEGLTPLVGSNPTPAASVGERVVVDTQIVVDHAVAENRSSAIARQVRPRRANVVAACALRDGLFSLGPLQTAAVGESRSFVTSRGYGVVARWL